MDTTRSRIEQIRSRGFELDFTETFNDTFEIYKKIAVNAGLLFIIIAIVGTIVVVGLAGAILGFAAITESLSGFDPAAAKSPVFIVGYILFISVLSGFFAPVT
ncbi:MAG TPA: hypothetical protein VFQ50_10760, partial [Flavobacterium sp.]|nr:hypothetical protein [Flavobacterium sp.]